MLKDFRDGSKDIITMFKGTDKTHLFQYSEPDGSAFIWSNYTVICEGRLSPMSIKNELVFYVNRVLLDEGYFIKATFPSSLITEKLRENRIYWRVIATNNIDQTKQIIRYGEIWLKET